MQPNPEVDAYIANAAPETQEKLKQMRAALQAQLPETEEVMSYGMPAYKQNKVLVYFAPAKHHIGYYPTGSGIVNFTDQFEALGLKYSKGAVQFPLDQPLPLDLIKDIAYFRQQEDTLAVKKRKK